MIVDYLVQRYREFWKDEFIEKWNLLVSQGLHLKWEKLGWRFVFYIKIEPLRTENVWFDQMKRSWFWVIVAEPSEFDVRSKRDEIL
jgi:hypothetical protein